MSRRKTGKHISGIILLDKPLGQSSNRALQSVRRLFDAQKAGHTGNLDPLATGMLPLCFGEASKTAAFMIDADKSYRATARLGIATETGDTEGRISKELEVPVLTESEILEVFGSFTGDIEQIPPMYSALKHEGQPLYKLAREGKTIERPPRSVTIHHLSLLQFSQEKIEFEVSCSKGTYIRTLAEDIAIALKTCAHLVSLRRLVVKPFDPTGMVTMEQLISAAEYGSLDQYLLPVDAGLPHWPMLVLDASQTAGFLHGRRLKLNIGTAGMVRVYGPESQPLGLAEFTDQGLLKPKRVFNLESS
jgi:tRNA pseudouridine55 synthase